VSIIRLKVNAIFNGRIMTENHGGWQNPPVFHIHPRPSRDWGAALVVACLVLGFTLSWASYELRQRLTQQADYARFRHDLDILVSQQSDLGQLLADPRTKLVRLETQDDQWPVRDLSVAWNDDRQTGVLFCRMLDTVVGQRLELWLVPGAGPAAPVDVGPAELGRTVYPFSPAGRSVTPREIWLTHWTDSDQPGAALAKGELE
jgi:hypothetical protein